MTPRGLRRIAWMVALILVALHAARAMPEAPNALDPSLLSRDERASRGDSGQSVGLSGDHADAPGPKAGRGRRRAEEGGWATFAPEDHFVTKQQDPGDAAVCEIYKQPGNGPGHLEIEVVNYGAEQLEFTVDVKMHGERAEDSIPCGECVTITPASGSIPAAGDDEGHQYQIFDLHITPEGREELGEAQALRIEVWSTADHLRACETEATVRSAFPPRPDDNDDGDDDGEDDGPGKSSGAGSGDDSDPGTRGSGAEDPGEDPEAPPEDTEPPPEDTEPPTEPTEPPPSPTEAPPEPTEAPPEPTEAPPEPTQAPPEPTEAPAAGGDDNDPSKRGGGDDGDGGDDDDGGQSPHGSDDDDDDGSGGSGHPWDGSGDDAGGSGASGYLYLVGLAGIGGLGLFVYHKLKKPSHGGAGGRSGDGGGGGGARNEIQMQPVGEDTALLAKGGSGGRPGEGYNGAGANGDGWDEEWGQESDTWGKSGAGAGAAKADPADGWDGVDWGDDDDGVGTPAPPAAAASSARPRSTPRSGLKLGAKKLKD
ncbi:unnamed protein product [Pedinophyceae sp. YPF-701]|nr:unnamed protein product [Pedinophyceae sp. YPF-701]